MIPTQTRPHGSDQCIRAHGGQIGTTQRQRIGATACRTTDHDRLITTLAQRDQRSLGTRRIDSIDHHMGCGIDLRIDQIGLQKSVHSHDPRVR